MIINNKGISLLLVVIIISAVTMLIAYSATITGVEESITGLHQSKALEIFSATDGCMEEAIIKIKNSSTYTGESLTIGDVSCTITVSGSGTSRILNITSTMEGLYTREIEADVDWSSTFQVTAWREIST
ncbi:hypothetical protein KKG71_06640 [Patescibacteria group bacterium]|nr:hypothetical protein [Patescibacteria group bacterium]